MIKNLYLTDRLFICLGIVIILFCVGYSYAPLFPLGKFLLLCLIIIFLKELYSTKKLLATITVERKVANKLSLHDLQMISYYINSNHSKKLTIELTDELPFQFQHRSHILASHIDPYSQLIFDFPIRPSERGQYVFGDIHININQSWPGLIQLRKSIKDPKLIKVYPSFIQMRKYELELFSMTASHFGIRQIRRIGRNDEFEHIKKYIYGDSIKAINWKASSRTNSLMINQYQDSRSQNVYCIIDKGRTMKMPFEGLTLMDYAINTTLVMSNIILKKYDNVGLITFSNNVDSLTPAHNSKHHLHLITDQLYNQSTSFKESSIDNLYFTIRQKITRRSIIILFTNYETISELERQLVYLKAISINHLFIIVFFENTELLSVSTMKCETIEDIYTKTFAQKSIQAKRALLSLLKTHGIQAILTTPDKLSLSTINKYLEFKAKRML